MENSQQSSEDTGADTQKSAPSAPRPRPHRMARHHESSGRDHQSSLPQHGSHASGKKGGGEDPVGSLNDAILLELGYLDAVIAMPFRVIRRTVGQGSSNWAKNLDELTWAAEGMARVPVKVLQAAFGEPQTPEQH